MPKNQTFFLYQSKFDLQYQIFHNKGEKEQTRCEEEIPGKYHFFTHQTLPFHIVFWPGSLSICQNYVFMTRPFLYVTTQKSTNHIKTNLFIPDTTSSLHLPQTRNASSTPPQPIPFLMPSIDTYPQPQHFVHRHQPPLPNHFSTHCLFKVNRKRPVGKWKIIKGGGENFDPDPNRSRGGGEDERTPKQVIWIRKKGSWRNWDFSKFHFPHLTTLGGI